MKWWCGEEINALLPKAGAEKQKITKLSVKCLKDLIEATNLYVNFDDCFKEFNAVLIKVYVGARKPKGGGRGAIQENSLTKHKVKYESISKKTW